jgi:hypothetical protein
MLALTIGNLNMQSVTATKSADTFFCIADNQIPKTFFSINNIFKTPSLLEDISKEKLILRNNIISISRENIVINMPSGLLI